MRNYITILLVYCSLASAGQSGYRVNSQVADLAMPATLNTTQGLMHLKDIPGELIILDFFGTWCAPCIKALPHLDSLQASFKDKITVVLVSTETRERLNRFIEARQPFPFPIVVDNKNIFTDSFAPPAYPYTVVLDKTRKVIALTDALSLDKKMIAEWLAGNKGEPTVSTNPTATMTPVQTTLASANKLVQLSQEFIYAAKTGDSTRDFIERLQSLSFTELETLLTADDEKKAFWINLYNGYTQALLKNNPAAYKSRSKFFGSKQIIIAGHAFSLDDIEHGILRRSKIKWSLGYLNKLFPGKIEKKLRVSMLDYRLHFALNCGAKSCPPIAFYKPENLNPQLELAANAYLHSEVEYDAAANRLRLPAIMSWFRRDFGGKRKMIRMLKERKIIPADADPNISFKPYDWTLYTDNYKN